MYTALLGDIPLLLPPFHGKAAEELGPRSSTGFPLKSSSECLQCAAGHLEPDGDMGTRHRGLGSRLQLQPRCCAKPRLLPQLTALKPSSSICTVFCIYFPYYFLKGAGGYLSGSSPGSARSRGV